MQGFDVLSSDSSARGDEMTLLGFHMQEAASHAHLLAGRFLQPTSADLQIAISQQTAESLHVIVGDTLLLGFSSYLPQQEGGTKLVPRTLDVHVAGIFAANADELYWQGNSFAPSLLGIGISYQALMSTSTSLSLLTRLGNASGTDGGGVFFAAGQQPLLTWYSERS